MHLFTYGSLMFPKVWRRVAGRDFPSSPARLTGFSARGVAGESYPMLVPEDGVATEGVVYSGLDEEALARLDRFEGGSYLREQVVVDLPDGGKTSAWVYLAADPADPAILPSLWDAGAFEREHLEDFLEAYAPRE